MDELVEALRNNGYSRNANMTLSSVIANTMQDAQYSPGGSQNLQVLLKYEKEYGHQTMGFFFVNRMANNANLHRNYNNLITYVPLERNIYRIRWRTPNGNPHYLLVNPGTLQSLVRRMYPGVPPN